MTSKQIVTALSFHFDRVKNLVVPGFGGLPHTSDCDFLVIRPSGWAEEVEIKVTKADYLREFKCKDRKHRCLQHGLPIYLHKPYTKRGVIGSFEEWRIWDEAIANPNFEPVGVDKRKANALESCTLGYLWDGTRLVPLKHFWFAMPLELAQELLPQIPEYAGLLGLTPAKGIRCARVEILKQAPKLNGRKVTDAERRKVLESTYHRYWDLRRKESVA